MQPISSNSGSITPREPSPIPNDRRNVNADEQNKNKIFSVKNVDEQTLKSQWNRAITPLTPKILVEKPDKQWSAKGEGENVNRPRTRPEKNPIDYPEPDSAQNPRSNRVVKSSTSGGHHGTRSAVKRESPPRTFTLKNNTPSKTSEGTGTSSSEKYHETLPDQFNSLSLSGTDLIGEEIFDEKGDGPRGEYGPAPFGIPAPDSDRKIKKRSTTAEKRHQELRNKRQETVKRNIKGLGDPPKNIELMVMVDASSGVSHEMASPSRLKLGDGLKFQESASIADAKIMRSKRASQKLEWSSQQKHKAAFPEIFLPAKLDLFRKSVAAAKIPPGSGIFSYPEELAAKAAAYRKICITEFAGLAAPGLKLNDRLYALLAENFGPMLDEIYVARINAIVVGSVDKAPSVEALKSGMKNEIRKFVMREALQQVARDVQKADLGNGVFRDDAAAVKDYSAFFGPLASAHGQSLLEIIERHVKEGDYKGLMSNVEVDSAGRPKSNHPAWNSFMAEALPELFRDLKNIEFTGELELAIVPLLHEVDRVVARDIKIEGFANKAKLALMRALILRLVIPYVNSKVQSDSRVKPIVVQVYNTFAAMLMSIVNGTARKNYSDVLNSFIKVSGDELEKHLVDLISKYVGRPPDAEIEHTKLLKV